MKALLKGKNKIQAICEELKKEAIDPAKEQAKEIVDNAQKQAEKIIKEAKEEASNIIEEGKRAIEQERQVFLSSMELSAKQVKDKLRQDIEQKLFNDQLEELLTQGTQEPKVVAKLIDVVLEAIEKEGISTELKVLIPQKIKEKEVVELLVSSAAKKLQKEAIELGDFKGGIKIKLVDKKMVVDISEQALKELLVAFARKDFRKTILAS